MKSMIWIFIFAISLASPTAAKPVTINNCGAPLTFNTTPEKIVIHDINMAQMAFALDLQDKIVGLTGISGWYKTGPEFDQQRGDIPELAPKYPTLENLIMVEPDLFFAGWYYGMKPGGEVTPDTLLPLGIKTMILTESCIHQAKKQPVASMDLLFDDVLRLGRVMGVEDKAKTLIFQWKAQLAKIERKTANRPKPRVFLLDGPSDAPLTSGRYAIAHAMISAAGGENIMAELATSWGRTSWEIVAAKNPEFLILLDYQRGQGAAETFTFLQNHPVMSQTAAVKNNHWIGLRYEELTPGPVNISAIAKMAKAMHQ